MALLENILANPIVYVRLLVAVLPLPEPHQHAANPGYNRHNIDNPSMTKADHTSHEFRYR